jgi:hypothetical protein
MSIVHLASAGFLAALLACRPVPSLQPRVILHSESVGNEFWLSAPHVLAVTILGAQVKGPRDAALVLVKFSARVENVIAGGDVGRNVDFYFFAKTDQRPRYWLDVGHQYIVSLRTEGGVLRSMADATQLALRVYSGRHEQSKIPKNWGPGEAIAYVLLTPGLDCDISTFKRHLEPWALDTLASMASLKYIAWLLSELQAHPDKGLRERACLAVVQTFWSQPECLASCLQSSDNEVSQTAKRLVDAPERIGVVDRLKNDALSFAPSRMEQYVRDRLEMFLFDARPEVRRTACRRLEEMFPEDRFPGCK